MKISLSILSADYANIEQSINNVLSDIDCIHFDVMDGVFVPNISYGYSFVRAIRRLTPIHFDTHLMIQHPQNYIEDFVKAGSDSITFHVEADCDVLKTIDLIHHYGVLAGIAIKPNTNVEDILSYLPYVDRVMVMSVEPGFGGQKFMDSSIDKVKKLFDLKKEKQYTYEISIDGGINDITYPKVKEYLDMVVVGSYVCKATCSLENLKKIRNI